MASLRSGSGKSYLTRDILEHTLATGRFDRVLRVHDGDDLPEVVADGAKGRFLDLSTEDSAKAASSSSAAGATVLKDCIKAIALAEQTRDTGLNALLVFDTISPFLNIWNAAVAWAEEARGSAMNPDFLSVQRRAYFAGLLERTALLLNNGSLTILAVIETDALKAVGFSSSGAVVATGDDDGRVFELSEFGHLTASNLERLRRLSDKGVPLTKAVLNKIDVPLPRGTSGDGPSEESKAMRELQSLSDGQIILSAEAAAAGQFPAMHAGATFSRFGLGSTEGKELRPQRDVRPPALQAVAAHLRMELALQEEARFRPPTSSDSGGDRSQDAHVARMAVVRAALQQPPRAHLPAEDMTALLLAVTGGSLDAMPAEQAAAAVRGGAGSPLLQHLRQAAPQLLERFRGQAALSESTIQELDVAVRLFAAMKQP